MKKFLLLIVVVFVVNSCVKNNPDPAWIKIEPWNLEVNSDLNGAEGALTSNFKNAWVFADGKLIGVFELPAKVPILSEGSVKLQIYPTIENNGISATKKVYPFVEQYEVTVNLVKNETIVLNPVTRYKTMTKFWIENFDDSFNFKFETDVNSMASLIYGNDPQYLKWGTGYGLINLTPTDSTFLAYTKDSQNQTFSTWPKGQEIYLEIDYINTNSLVTGLIELSSQAITNHPNIQLNGQNIGAQVWKKIYIDLREIVSGTPTAEYYKIYLQAALQSGGLPRDVIIDNVKLIYFQ